MILPIYIAPNPILGQKAEPVGDINPEIAQLVKDMRETMLNAEGVGLAAPQIGKSIALIVIELPVSAVENETDAIPYTVLINPRVTWNSPYKCLMVEGCLSVPGKEANIKRPSKVRIKATNIEGREFEIKAEGLMARVILHELDHLKGHLFIDYVKSKDIMNRDQVDYPRIQI